MTSLLISVDRRSARPLYQQIYDTFRKRITRGELRPGHAVPSTRELSRELRVSRLPVLNAYAQLNAEGYFESRVGAGTFVASSLRTEAAKPRPRSQQNRRISANAAALPKYERPAWAGYLGPFQIGQPDLDSFPRRLWARIESRHARHVGVKALQYGDPRGLDALREVIANHVRTWRGVRCEADQIVVVSGSQQALDLATRVLLDPGDVAWVEEPGYWLVHQVLAVAGCRAVPVPVDSDGLDVAAGIKSGGNVRAAFVAPSHQYPLGVTMTATRRLQLLEWAEGAGAWIIEDDYDSEYRYDSNPIASLQGLDRNGRVIYIGTFSKVMFPSLRLGYLVVPEDLVERFIVMRRAMDLCPAMMTQGVMAEFIREGHFARHIRRTRSVYAERRATLVEEVTRQLGDQVTLIGDGAGMHIGMFLEAKRSDRAIAAKAAKQLLWLSALSEHYAGASPRAGFVLGFGNTRAAQIAPAIQQLRRLLR